MTDPAFEELIEYRRQLRKKHAETPELRWGVTQVALDYPARKVWHLTQAKEAPCRAECGYLLVELAPRGRSRPERACRNCQARSPVFPENRG